jgi:hypothetical protein
MNELENMLSGWKAKNLFGVVKTYKLITFTGSISIYQISLISVTTCQNEIPTIKFSRYFIPKGTNKDLNRLLDFLQVISNDYFLVTIGVI